MSTSSVLTRKDYIETHQQRFLDELFDLLRIPSVSTDPAFAQDMHLAAEFVRARLEAAGADVTEICPTAGYPIVYGEKMVDKSKPTVLVYGHYDVQPADPYELWHSPPFEPVLKDGKIYARGASDDKGQMYMHIKALETLLQTDGLPCNVKFMIEGEEEGGSGHLGDFVRDHRQKLAADVVLVSDTGILSNEQPSITVGLRGMTYVEVEVTGPNRDLHSGMYGGAVANPINVLCQMIAALQDADGRITIPGFYDDVEELSAEDRAAMNAAPFRDEEFNRELGIAQGRGEAGYTTLERKSIRPTFDVNGIWGGYTGQGAKTVLPSKAHAKISMRLVPHQQSDKITELFTRHFEALAPAGVTVKVTPHHGGEPAVVPTDYPAYQAAHAAVEAVWGKAPIPMREGGSIPIVTLFERELGLKTVLMGFGLDTDAIHSPNEHYGVFNFLKGIETIAEFYHQLAAQAEG